jgi:hypothetical protein
MVGLHVRLSTGLQLGFFLFCQPVWSVRQGIGLDIFLAWRYSFHSPPLAISRLVLYTTATRSSSRSVGIPWHLTAHGYEARRSFFFSFFHCLPFDGLVFYPFTFPPTLLWLHGLSIQWRHLGATKRNVEHEHKHEYEHEHCRHVGGPFPLIDESTVRFCDGHLS